ncbi:hypothetical protein IWX64_003039 [Arthrobacter sp. CAN_A212]
MNDIKKAGTWTFSIGVALSLTMVLLMLISRMLDPNGVPILPALLLMVGGLASIIGLALLLVGMRTHKS